MRKIALAGRHPQVADALLAVVVAMFTLVESTQPDRQYQHPLVMIPAALLVTLPLAIRRRRPVFVLLFLMAVEVVAALLVTVPASAGMFVALLIATYSVFAYCPRRTALRTVPALVIGAIVVELRDPSTHGPVEALPTFGILAAVVMVAVVVRRSRQQAEHLRRLAAELSVSRSEAERLAVAAERLRIARDMHDVLAHGVSVMTLQAGAARMALHDSAPVAQNLLVGVEKLGREALEELRDILGLLRGSGTSGSTPPVTSGPDTDGSRDVSSDLDRLLATMRVAGLLVTLHGVDVLEGLPARLALPVLRVIQEALTNTFKHAGPVATSVLLQRTPGTVAVEILDSGTARDRPRVPGGGHGLAGVRERITDLGGTVVFGPKAEGGWRVRAELPFDDAAVVPAGAQA